MSGAGRTPSLTGGVTLLERAISYTLGSLHIVTPAALPYPTPCPDWDLRALLGHMNDSLAALHEAIDTGHVASEAVGRAAPENGGDAAVDLVATLRNRACRLLGAWTQAPSSEVISIAGCPLTTSIVTGTGAVEITVHGWDVARACGHERPIPPPLAEEMLELSPLLITDADRPGRFAAPVEVSPLATPGDRLLAFLGRHPF